MSRLFSITFLLFLAGSVWAQPGFHMIPNVAYGSGHTGNMDIKIRADVVNETDTAIEIGWERIVVEIPDIWATYVCSNITCAPPDAEFGSMLVPANDTVNLDCHFLPEATVGEGKVILKLFAIPDTSMVKLMEYNVDVQLVLSQSNQDLNDKPFFLYPNPTFGDVTYIYPNDLKSILIFNSLGQVVREVTEFSQTRFSLDGLPSGHYFLRIEEAFRNKIKVLPIQKL